MARCAAINDGRKMSARHICIRTIFHFQMLSRAQQPAKSMTCLLGHILGIIGIQSKSLKLKRGIWCLWQRPSLNRYKLNIDGSSRSESITGGGVLRDDRGNMIVIFSHYYGQGTNIMAEFLALRDGLELCKTLDVLQLDIESDSAVVVQAVRGNIRTAGSLFMFYRNALTFGKIHSPFIMLSDRSMVLLIGVRIGHTVIESNANASRV